MAVTHAGGDETGEHIEVAPSGVVPQILHVSLSYQERFLVEQIRCQAWVHVSLPEIYHSFVCGTLHQNGGLSFMLVTRSVRGKTSNWGLFSFLKRKESLHAI